MSRTRVKICGLTSPEDVRLAADAGADAIGLNFYPKSKRYLDPRAAMPLIRALPPFLDAVGVFVEMPLRQVCALAFQLGLGAVQCFADTAETGDSFPFRMIVAFRIKDESSLDQIRSYVTRAKAMGRPPAAVLVDAHVEGELGGTGHTAPWEMLAGFSAEVPLILAGGLTPENVATAIRIVRPYGVDVASGVESAPGKKDPIKVRQFIEAVRSTE